MKNLITLLVFILVTKIAFAQQKDTASLSTPFVNGEVIYQKVSSATGKSKALLFSNARLWFIKHYRNFNSFQIQDDVTGRVVGKGLEVLTFKGVLGLKEYYDVSMQIQIDCKDGRYRAQVFNILVETEGANKVRNYIYAEQLMNDLLGIKTNITLVNAPNPFTKNQSRKALENLNILVDDLLASINQTMNDSNNF